MAKARNIYGVGPMAQGTLPRSRIARQRLVALLQPVSTGQAPVGLPVGLPGSNPVLDEATLAKYDEEQRQIDNEIAARLRSLGELTHAERIEAFWRARNRRHVSLLQPTEAPPSTIAWIVEALTRLGFDRVDEAQFTRLHRILMALQRAQYLKSGVQPIYPQGAINTTTVRAIYRKLLEKGILLPPPWEGVPSGTALLIDSNNLSGPDAVRIRALGGGGIVTFLAESSGPDGAIGAVQFFEKDPENGLVKRATLRLRVPPEAILGSLGFVPGRQPGASTGALAPAQRALIARAIATARQHPDLARLAREAWNDRDLLSQVATVLRQANTRDALLAAIDARIAALGDPTTGQAAPLDGLYNLFSGINSLQAQISDYERQAEVFRGTPRALIFQNLAQQTRAQLQGVQAQFQVLQAQRNARWNADFEAARQAVVSIFNTPQAQSGLEVIAQFITRTGEWVTQDVNSLRQLSMATALDPLIAPLQSSGRSPTALAHLQQLVIGLRTPPLLLPPPPFIGR